MLALSLAEPGGVIPLVWVVYHSFPRLGNTRGVWRATFVQMGAHGNPDCPFYHFSPRWQGGEVGGGGFHDTSHGSDSGCFSVLALRDCSKPLPLSECFYIDVRRMRWHKVEDIPDAPKNRYCHTSVYLPHSDTVCLSRPAMSCDRLTSWNATL